MPRQLDNWLTAYGEWTLPRSESPESMIIWAGLFAVSSAVKRHIYFPKRLMGSYAIYPNIYVIYVGKPGVVRKSTTAGYAERLLHSLDTINLASTAMSASKLIEIMSETLDGSLTILASELGTFMNVSKDEMYDLLTDLYDGKVRYDYATRMHGVEIVENPCVNFLAATTPSWVAEQMPLHVIGGGFASRCIFIFEDRKRRRQLYYDIDWRKYEELGKALENDLKHISELEGEFRHESKAVKQAMEDWYQAMPEEYGDERVEGYFNRKHVHVHKLAMLLSVCERDDLVVTLTHFEAAKALLEGLEERMPRAFTSVGRNPFSDDILKVLEFINETGGGEAVERKHIARRFFHQLQGPELDEVLATLTTMGELEFVKHIGGKNVRAYKPTGQGF